MKIKQTKLLINLNLDNAASTLNSCNNNLNNRISSDQHFYTYLKQYSTKLRSSINCSFDLINENSLSISNVKINRENIHETINNINNKTVRSSKIKNVISNIKAKNKLDNNNKNEIASSSTINIISIDVC
jgi:hypothetical protein